MPLPNYYSARILDPKLFKKHHYDKNKFGEDVDVIWGIKDGKASVQAIRFSKSKYSKALVNTWLKRNNFKAMTIEEDAGPASTIMGPANMPTTTTADIAQYVKRVGPMVSRQGDRKKKKKEKTIKETLEWIVDDR